jgi:hypothetical protein
MHNEGKRNQKLGRTRRSEARARKQRTRGQQGGAFLVFCRVGAPPRLKTETDPVSETLCFLFVEIQTMDKVQKLNSNESKDL